MNKAYASVRNGTVNTRNLLNYFYLFKFNGIEKSRAFVASYLERFVENQRCHLYKTFTPYPLVGIR